MTPRLYFEDPLLIEFDASVESSGEVRSGSSSWPSVVLSRTAFYPEAGGQMADRGTLELGGVRTSVIDVQADDAGIVHHRVEADRTLDIGVHVRGSIDRARRRVHMALHTGQHMLSRALLDEAGAPTVSARLGETACTIDIDKASVLEEELARAEDLVNDIIDDGRRVRAFFPKAEELGALELRRAPKVSKDVRVVVVDDFDVTPCGGTHCTSTAQVGLVKIVGIERYKGKTRLTFTAGKRARVELGGAWQTLARVAERLTTGPETALAAVEKLRSEMTAERERNGRLARELAMRVADDLVAAAKKAERSLVAATIPGASTDVLRAVAGRITKEPGFGAFLAGEDAGARPVVFSRHADASLDCGAMLKAIAARSGGRGGGRPEHAEGRLPLSTDIEQEVQSWKS